MHTIQKKLLALTRNTNIGDRSLRDIAKLIGETHPEKIKHHLKQLEKKGFIEIDPGNNTIRNVNRQYERENLFINIPIVGTANCGPAELLAEENITGHLKLSRNLLRSKSSEYFIVQADGDSMNQSKINGECIESGDYVVIRQDSSAPTDGEYVLAIVDGGATLKKIKVKPEQGMVYLVPESSQKYMPIILDADQVERELQINGRIEQVIKM